MSEENKEITAEVVAEATPVVAPQNTAPVLTRPAINPRTTSTRPIASRGARLPRAVGAATSAGGPQARSTFRRPFVKREGDTSSAPGASGRPMRRGGDRGPRKGTFEDRRPEFEQKILSIRRVVRVVSGGRRLSFAVTMIIGDKKGAIGVGTGKSIDTSNAIQKALKNAKKNLVKLKLTKENSIPFDVQAKYATSQITMMPNRGKGLVAGSAARDIMKLGGLKNVTSKFHSGSKNKLNNARATILALSQFAVKRMPGINFDTEPKGVEVTTEVVNG